MIDISEFKEALKMAMCQILSVAEGLSKYIIIFTQPLRSDRIWHKVNFLSGV